MFGEVQPIRYLTAVQAGTPNSVSLSSLVALEREVQQRNSGKFNNTTLESSDASNATVHLEHARIFI
jgi:hypothetical protein